MVKKYTEKDIQVLSDNEHVRMRLPVYAGSTSKSSYMIPFFNGADFNTKTVEFIPAVYKCIGEVIDNSIDEFSQTDNKAPALSITANSILGTYEISDNGRGVPIGKHSTGKYTPELVFGSLRSGRNFSDNKEAGVIGMNGMGSSITCFCSTDFKVDIHRDNKRYRQAFSDGGTIVSKPVINRSPKSPTGTSVSFQLDDAVFDDVTLPDELMTNRAIELALTNPGLRVTYNGTKYRYPRGFTDIVSKLSKDYFKFSMNNLEFFVIFDWNTDIDEKIFSWVNSSLLFDGGLCNTQFLNAFYDHTIKHLSSEAKKNKCEVTKNDIRRNLLVIGNLKLSDPEYDAQSKTRLTGPNIRKEVNDLIDIFWNTFVKKQKGWLTGVMEHAIKRHNSHANTKAVKEHKKSLHKKVPGLIDATDKNRNKCSLFITEGLSAASQLTDMRDPKHIASLPLTGKINNVWGSTIAQLLKMGKITNLLTAIGLVPGHPVDPNLIRYGKIVIASDADVDGDSIFALLVNLFYQFWPELMDGNKTRVYRLMTPNVCLVKGKKRVHIQSLAEYDKVKNRYKGYEVKYFKGLAGLTPPDWEMILSNLDESLLPVIDDGAMKSTLNLIFGPDADKRKDWLTIQEDIDA